MASSHIWLYSKKETEAHTTPPPLVVGGKQPSGRNCFLFQAWEVCGKKCWKNLKWFWGLYSHPQYALSNVVKLGLMRWILAGMMPDM